MVILYNTCAFRQNLIEFPVSAIPGLLIAMRCNSTFPAISDLVVMTMATFYSIPPSFFLYLEFGNS